MKLHTVKMLPCFDEFYTSFIKLKEKLNQVDLSSIINQ